ncbi:hypothetical protein RND71_017730 [Anisodus tanguticus]|uniref:RRM domain-containing protein n=1 Tax=Anisodus tanguticus TaxID=243964 RepID=A0AAE1S149_9SOLA|nr:hypothetical protein RND71_017730 [Anisodus tanguticus]
MISSPFFSLAWMSVPSISHLVIRSVFSLRLVIDRETGKPKGYGFCEYKDEETALSARRNLQGYEINGRQLRVDFAENDKKSDGNRDQLFFEASVCQRATPNNLSNVQLQTPNIRQSAAPQLQPLLLDSQRNQQLATRSLPGLPPLPPNLLPQARPQIQLAQPGQNQVLLSQLPTPSRILPSMQPQVNVSINPPVQVGIPSAIKQQMQPSFLQQAGPAASSNFTYNNQLGTASTSYPPPPSMRPPLLEQGFQGNPSAVSGVLDNTNKDSRRPQAPNNSSLITRPAYPSGLSEEKRGASNNLDLLSRPPKQSRLNDGISYALPVASVSMPLPGPSTQVSVAAEVSNPDKQASQVQLPSDVESALLQQVLSLTPEQLSSLPPDQQQQVIQLQLMLRQPT